MLFTKKTNHTANIVLAIATFALSVDVFHSAYLIFGYYKEFIHFTGVTYAFPFLYGPIFYIYAKLISSGSNSFNKNYFLHFIPFILVVLYGIIFVYFEGSELKLALIRNELDEVPLLPFITFLKPVHGIIYTLLTINVARDYNNKIRSSYSNIERINLNWLRHLAIGLSVIWSVVLLVYVVNIVSTKEIEMDHLIYMAASVLIYSIGYLSLRQPQIFQKVPVKEDEKFTANLKKIPEEKSYRRSGLTDEDAENHLKNLLGEMETGKPYLNSELTLGELAAKLSMSTHNLSEILNTKLNQNFYDFINRYRVEEVKRRLDDK
ncbi:MAG TPA: hypothetical protein VLN45_05035 [Ignavibacteriaceae bacterium]|nr:hypothetical protein [Ignavibacteriaceae bacterium]